jgi:hypothetical protein
MSVKEIALGFAPWVVFALVATRGGVGIAAVLGFVLAAALLVRAVVRGSGPKLLEITAAATFAVIAGWALLSPASDAFLAAYGQGAATLVLAAVIGLTLPVRPFTEQYARETVPREHWDSPRFHSVNRRISAVWGGTLAAMGAANLLGNALGGLVLTWIVPVLLVVAALRWTQRVAAAA